MKSSALRFRCLTAACLVLAGIQPVAAQAPAAANEAAQIKTLLDAAQKAQGERAFGQAREHLEALLARTGITIDQRIDVLNRLADTWLSKWERKPEEARRTYARILALPDLATSQRIDARNRTAAAWSMEGAHEQARAEYAWILALPDLPVDQRVATLLRMAETWRTEWRLDEARAAHERILALPAASLNQRIDALNRLADTWLAERKPEEARRTYARILALPDLEARQRIDAHNRTAAAWSAEGSHDQARAEYARILAWPDLSVDQRVETLLRTADAWLGAGNAAEALQACATVAALPDLAPKHRPGLLQRQAAALLAKGEMAAATAAIAELAQGGPAAGASVREACQRLAGFAAARLDAREFEGAAAAYGQLAGITNIDLRVRGPAVKGLVRCCAGLRSAEARTAALKALGALLDELVAHPGTAARDRQIARLQRAAIPALGDGTAAAEQALDALLAGDALGDEQAKVALLQDANILFMSARAYTAARLLKARIDARLAAAYAPNRYTCRFLEDAPAGAGAWAASGFVAAPANLNTAFLPYPGGEEEKLAADMGAVRPLAEKEPEAMRGRETAIAMAYDTRGWHLFIRCDDPDIAQIMREGGRRGSTLEMFFAPGLKDEVYYQWIVKLAEKQLSIYDWNTPHRFYRYLENRPGSLQAETAVLPRGWATLVTVGWEAVYDKLPFIEGNESTWRFSTMRWGPVSMTWGGTVHEPGRWGLVEFAPPTPAQLTEIRRELVRKAWWRYTSRRDALKDYWRGARGDPAFLQQVLTPFFQQQDAFAERMSGVGAWTPEEVAVVFQGQVPVWMEIDVLVDEQRKQYLKQALTAD